MNFKPLNHYRNVYFGLGLNGSSLVQQDLNDPNMTISGSTVKWSQLILYAEIKRNGM